MIDVGILIGKKSHAMANTILNISERNKKRSVVTGEEN